MWQDDWDEIEEARCQSSGMVGSAGGRNGACAESSDVACGGFFAF